jgi:hypothetical protein
MFKHFLFTRWNLLDSQTTIYNNPKIEDPGEWMKHRMELFDEHTLPSVMLQTNSNFTWLLAFDKKTPDWILSKYATFPRIKVIFEYPADWLRRELSEVFYGYGLPGDWLITSRLDNDDIILPEYIETVQSYFDETFKLVDVDGVKHVLSNGNEYSLARKSNNSPFISLIEQVGVPWLSISDNPEEKRLIDLPVKTVYYCSHSKMEWHFPSVKSPKKLAKMLIHDRNIINKIEGNEILL